VRLNLNENPKLSPKTPVYGIRAVNPVLKQPKDSFLPRSPDNYEEYREPFLGGGSVAIHTTQAYPRSAYLGK
jgi:hypothetical protein